MVIVEREHLVVSNRSTNLVEELVREKIFVIEKETVDHKDQEMDKANVEGQKVAMFKADEDVLLHEIAGV